VHGHFWYVPNVGRTAEFPHVMVDVNYWKTFVHAGLATAAGDRGCISLFGKDGAAHELFAELDAEYTAMIERQDANRATEQKEHDDYIAGLNEQEADALAMVAKDKAKEIAEAQNALDAATKEWQDAIEEARRKREAAEKGMATGEPPPGMPEAPPALTDAVKKGMDAASGVAEKLQGALSSRGTFSSVALAGLAGGDVTDRIAKASEETARNTKRIKEEVEDAEGVFV